MLTAVDFGKAFNRVSHQACLEAFSNKGASTPILRLIATFLSERRMTVRVGNDFYDCLPVNGGCPQCSVIGVYLFNVCSDELEDAGRVEDVLGESSKEVDVGDFFDPADKEFITNIETLDELLIA